MDGDLRTGATGSEGPLSRFAEVQSLGPLATEWAFLFSGAKNDHFHEIAFQQGRD
jgi:hypothetical protein